MVWVYIALAIPATFCLLAYLLKFGYSLEFDSQSGVAVNAALSFLWIKKKFQVNWNPPSEDEENPPGEKGNGNSQSWTNVRIPNQPNPTNGKAAFMATPFAEYIPKFKLHFPPTAMKWVLAIPVCKSPLGYPLG